MVKRDGTHISDAGGGEGGGECLCFSFFVFPFSHEGTRYLCNLVNQIAAMCSRLGFNICVRSGVGIRDLGVQKGLVGG